MPTVDSHTTTAEQQEQNLSFVERRQAAGDPPGKLERRQFVNGYQELSPNARELAQSIDEYKLRHRRRFITYEEMYNVILSLGYRRDEDAHS